MVIIDIRRTKKQLKHDMWENWKKLTFYSLVQHAFMVIGTVMFFYVEECYFLVQQEKIYSSRCTELCPGILKLNQSGHFVNLTTATTTTTTKITPTTTNESLIAIFREMVDNCQKKECIENNTPYPKNCTLNEIGFIKWGLYTSTIIYTIGTYCAVV